MLPILWCVCSQRQMRSGYASLAVEGWVRVTTRGELAQFWLWGSRTITLISTLDVGEEILDARVRRPLPGYRTEIFLSSGADDPPKCSFQRRSSNLAEQGYSKAG